LKKNINPFKKKLLPIWLIVFSIYLISGKNYHTQHHFFVPLAEAFLKGRLYVNKMTYYLHEMVSQEEVKTGVYKKFIDGAKGKYYVIYPPLPAVLLIPWIIIFGEQANQSLFSILIASFNAVIFYKIFQLFKLEEKKSLWLMILFAFGSMQWYHAVIGSSWYYASICATFFILLAIYGLLKGYSLFWIGLLVGLAYLCRFPAILSFPFFLLMVSDRWFKNNQFNLGPIRLFFSGLILLLIVSFIYNYLRYGTIWHLGYQLLESRDYNINNEYKFGSYSLSYFPRHLKAIFWSFSSFKNQFPYIFPNLQSMALWIVMPAIILVFWAPIKKKIVWTSWLTVFFIALASVFHGGIGATQFGYRYALDYLPFLFLIMAEAIRKRFFYWQKGLIILSILINGWGIYYNFWHN